MTVIARGWDRLTLPGKIVFTVVPLLVALTVAAVAVIVVFGQPIIPKSDSVAWTTFATART